MLRQHCGAHLQRTECQRNSAELKPLAAKKATFTSLAPAIKRLILDRARYGEHCNPWAVAQTETGNPTNRLVAYAIVLEPDQ
jgi:hypothetical protein